MNENDTGGPYFTVIVNEHCGIADKLLNRFTVLMSLGAACGMSYVHSPLNFGRSNSAGWKRLARKAYVELFLHVGLLMHPSIRRWFQRTKSTVGKFTNVQGCAVYTFLGLDQFNPTITESQFKNCERVEIDVARYFASNKESDLKAFSEFIATQGDSQNSRRIYCLQSGDGFYDEISGIRQFLNDSAPGQMERTIAKLRTQFWDVPQRFADHLSMDVPIIRLVFHIRAGDRATIRLPTRKLVFFGDRIALEALEPGNRNGSSEHGYGPEILSGYRKVMQRIINELAGQKYSCTVISDGYERALFYLIDAMSRGQIELSKPEVRCIRAFQHEWQSGWRAIAAMKSTQMILGESLKDTLESIQAISQADVLVRGQGGFSWGVHRLYSRKPDSIVVNMREFSDGHLQKIKNLALSLQSIRRPSS